MNMGKRLRFVTPDVVRLDLSDGDWLEVKRKLTVGERRGILSRAAKGGVSTDGQRVHLDGAEMAFARVETWLLDWSFVGADDKPMKLSPAALRSLDSDSFREIEDALDAHEEAEERVKNSLASKAPGSSTLLNDASGIAESSPSVLTSIGATSN